MNDLTTLLAAEIDALKEKLNKAQEENILLRSEVQHYRAAVAAVKWLFEKADEQPAFPA